MPSIPLYQHQQAFYVKAISPEAINTDRIWQLIEAALKKEGEEQVKLLEQTTAHWSITKPRFVYEIERKQRDVTLTVKPSGDAKAVMIWLAINNGTKPYVIKPRRAKYLRFQTGYRAGSSWGTLRTTRSSRSGPWVSAKQVRHPGIDARMWLGHLMNERRNKFIKAVIDALHQGMRY